MKRLLLALAAASLIGASLLLPTTTASSELVEALDAKVETESALPEVTAGKYGVFSVEATLTGPTPATLVITDSVGGGAIDLSESLVDACGTAEIDANGALICSVALSPENRTATIHVAVLSSPTATQLFNHASVSMTGDGTLVGLDTDETNNQDDWTIPVTAGSTSAAFVPEGKSLTYSANGQTHVLTVTDAKGGGGGALVSMSDPGVMTCGASPCNGVHVEFVQGGDGEFYEAATEIDSSGKHDPCRGLGTTACTSIHWRKLANDFMVPVPACGTEAEGQPCLRRKYKSDGGVIHYVTEMDTDDPDIGIPGIPTVGGAK